MSKIDDAILAIGEDFVAMVDRAMVTGVGFDEIIEEVKYQVRVAEENRAEYAA